MNNSHFNFNDSTRQAILLYEAYLNFVALAPVRNVDALEMVIRKITRETLDHPLDEHTRNFNKACLRFLQDCIAEIKNEQNEG